MYEVDEAARIITEASDAEANIIFGAVINDSYTGEVKITVVATGFDAVPRETASFRQHSSLNQTSAGDTSQPVMKNAEDELDIPAFIRKKMN
jgi:cell division protein FtsZ